MRIVLGVTGSVAAYKACVLTSMLVQQEHEVQVIMTKAAQKFVAPLSFRALSHREVAVNVEDEPLGPISHVHLARWAERVIIAPATLNTLQRLATGQADDMLSLVYFGFTGPVWVAPAMEPEMWDHVRTQSLVEQLRTDGVKFIGPRLGRMASGHEGYGRMAEPAEIVQDIFEGPSLANLTGVSVLITAGPTWEYFDPVRVLTNPSTGQMGALLADAAARRGARVTLIRGPRAQQASYTSVTSEAVISARDMLSAVQKHIATHDIVIGAAAVSDFRPKVVRAQKAHKGDVEECWEMEKNPDIMAWLGRDYRDAKLLIGFAAETHDGLNSAQRKLQDKNLDGVVFNPVGEQVGFGEGDYRATLLSRHASPVPFEPMTKKNMAEKILDWVVELYGKKKDKEG